MVIVFDMKTASCLLLCFAALIPSAANAIPITFICEVSDDDVFGTLNGTPFSGAFTYTVYANTDGIKPNPNVSGGYILENDSAEITIASLGTFQLTDPTVSRHVGFTFSINYLGSTHPPFYQLLSRELIPWDMRSPVSSFSFLRSISSPTEGIPITGGILQLDEAAVATTFSAIVTPEPSSLFLCIGSIVLVGIKRR